MDTTPHWNDVLRRIENEGAPLTDFSVPIPDDVRAYVSLGRFRNALVLDEESRRPTDALKRFINIYGLRPDPLSAAPATQGE